MRVTHNPLKIKLAETLPIHKLENSLREDKRTTAN